MRAVATHRSDDGFARGNSEFISDESRRISILPREKSDDTQRVHVGDRGQTCITGGDADRLGDEGSWGECLKRIIDTLQMLTDSDDDGGTRVECHAGNVLAVGVRSEFGTGVDS